MFATVLLLVGIAAGANASPYPIVPIIIVPGMSNSKIQFRMNNAQSKPGCFNNTLGWRSLWPFTPLDLISESRLECGINHLRFDYDPAQGLFFEPQGLQTRVPDFGSFDAVLQYGDLFYANFTKLGWEVGKNLFLAPYDWRLPGYNQTQFQQQLQTLIESTAAATGQRVSIIAMSEGPQSVLSFLYRMSQGWKNKYLAWFVASSPVWSGNVNAPLTCLSGMANMTQDMSLQLSRKFILNVPSVYWTWPKKGTNASYTWLADEPIILTPHFVYTAANLSLALRSLGFPAEADIAAHLAAEPELSTFAAPGVNTLVTYGTQTPTTATVTYAQDFASVGPTSQVPIPWNMTFSSGDGVVPLRSSIRSQTWAAAMAANGNRLIHQEYPNQPHAFCILFDQTCFDSVLSVITKPL